MKHVLVASQNQIKADATASAFERFLGEKPEIYLSDKEVPSGVPDQPMTQEQAVLGALNRLLLVRNEPDFDYFVAIEGGIYCVRPDGDALWYESACAATMTPNSKPSVAFGPAYPIPSRFVGALLNGKDLNQVMEAETGIKEAGRGAGFNGWLTDGQIDRQTASAEAVLLSLYGLKHQDHHE
jgi:inosine/xanthosine triphosphatase